MSAPIIDVDPALNRGYPSYFNLLPSQIGHVMTDHAGISPDRVSATHFSFVESGLRSIYETVEPAYIVGGQDEFTISLHGIARALDSGEQQIPETWQRRFPDNSTTALAHVILAEIIGYQKAQAELGTYQPSRPKLTSDGVRIGAGIGIAGGYVAGYLAAPYIGTNLTGLIGGVTGAAIGGYEAIRRHTKRGEREWNAKLWEATMEFVNDPSVAESLGGSLDFDLHT